LAGLDTLNLKAAVNREIDVHKEWKDCVVTLWAMSQFQL